MRAVILISLLFVLCGCESTPEQEFAEVHLNTVPELISLRASRPGLSANGDDYLFAGPVSIWNIHGTRHFLWLGYGTTIDRHIQGIPTPKVKQIVLMVDGKPMQLELTPWPEVAPNQPYAPDVTMLATYGVRVTINQLEHIVSGSALQATLVSTTDALIDFEANENVEPDWTDLGVARKPD